MSKVHSFKNPHTINSILLAERSGLEAPNLQELQAIESKGHKTCSCGKEAWFKHSVGTYVCQCGKLLRKGEWVDPTGKQ